MSRKPKSGYSPGANRMSPLQLFRRTLHGGRNLRNGLAKARTIVDPSHYPNIVRELSRIPMYESLFAQLTFPMSLKAVRSYGRLQEISTEGELMWTSSVLSHYVERLRVFVKLREQYYEAYNNANYELAVGILDSIQQTLGFSIWLLGNRLQLLQVTKGLEAQKNLVEEILSTKDINQFIAWITYFLSVRAEENVSYSSFKSELTDVLEESWIRDYTKLHLLSFEFTSIENPGLPMAIEEPHPIIDRLETFISMALIYCANIKEGDRSHAIFTLEQLESIAEPQINRLLMVLRGQYCAQESQLLELADAYTEGRYEHVLSSHCDGIELLSRSYGYLGRHPPRCEKPSPRDQFVEHIYEVSVLSADASLSRQKLKKLALLSPDRSIALEVAAFLERTPDYMGTGIPSTLEITAALSRPLNNPWSAMAIDNIAGQPGWFSRLSEAHPNSLSIRLRGALISGDAGTIEDNAIKLPAYRKVMYIGHVNYHAGQFDAASENYLSATASDIEFISHQAKRAVFKAYYASERLYEAVQLAIDQVLQYPAAASSYPLEALARRYLNEESARSSIDLAVLLHLAVRHCNAKLERDLSNVFENIIDAAEIDYPSSFRWRLEKYNATRLVYFLRYVCVPRILDDTTCFDTVEKIDQERIAICQLLLEIDQNNIDVYQAEIRAITRGCEVDVLLSKIQTSKIYVDEAGIRNSIEVSLSEPLSRYIKLLDSPNLAYQAEKLSKRISEMLTMKGHPEFKSLKLPATELEGLFNAMLLEAAAEFALNPAYGLDTHVSTSIRHGAFEGHLRRPLALEDLICIKSGKEYLLPSTWTRKLPALGAVDIENLQKLLGRFSQRYEELIHEYLKGKLHIRLVGDDVAMFDFHASSSEIKSLMDSITPNTTVHTLTERFMAHFWELTTRSLDAIRLDLLDYATKQMYSALDTLVRGVEFKMKHSEVAPFIDAVARARTNFQTAIEDVAGWFQRPTDLSRDPFDIEVATHVALQQIANCYVDNPIHPCLDLTIDEKIDGRMLDGLCEILFILLQNVIRHSGFGENEAEVTILSRREGDALILKCVSKLAEDVSINERRNNAVEAAKWYERDSALRMARREGGSGLSKVWRIAEFDLRVHHTLELSVTDNHEFVVKLSLAGVWV